MKFVKYLILMILFWNNYIHGLSQNTNNNMVNASNIVHTAFVSEDFALNLLKRISMAVSMSSYNFMISPYSIWSLLTLIMEGASGNTLEELLKTLKVEADLSVVREEYKRIHQALSINTSNTEISFSEFLFADKNYALNPEYVNVLKNIYKAEFVPINFYNTQEAQHVINNYVNISTKGSVDYVVNDHDLIDAQIILISAIFFKGQWKFPFNRTLTRKEMFYDEHGNIIGTVDMMYQKGMFSYTSVAALDSHILELPYGVEQRLSMIILLPKRGAIINSIIDKLVNFGVNNILAALKSTSEDIEEVEIEVHLPKFSTTTDFVLNIILEQMGILDLFDLNKSNLSKMSNSSLHLSRIFHKTRIDIDEEGTIASAVSGGDLRNKVSPYIFYINRPFVYIIIDKMTKSLLFCGLVKDPTKLNSMA